MLYPVNPVLLADWYATAGSVDVSGPSSSADGVTSTSEKETDGTLSPSPQSPSPVLPQSPSPVSENTLEGTEAPLAGNGLSGSDYFAAQGIRVDDSLPEVPLKAEKSDRLVATSGPDEFVSGPESPLEMPKEALPKMSQEKDLMVVMSFSEWLNYLESRSQKAKEEEDSQRAFKARWQQQKLAEALGEESDEIPETVFKMAVSSISREEEPVSETLAEVYLLQGKKAKAIELFEKLSLQNPEKNAYFAQKIAQLKKEIDI